MSVPQNEIIYEDDFRKDVHDLPKKVQDKLAILIEILREDSSDSRLHTKRLGPPLQVAFPFRIMRDYRVGFRFDVPHVIKLLVADKRDRIYQRLMRKL